VDGGRLLRFRRHRDRHLVRDSRAQRQIARFARRPV
jgi:hypothetical protein